MVNREMNRMMKLGLIALVMLMWLLPACALAQYSIPVADDALEAAQGLDENWINILFIGADAQGGSAEAGNADTLMICSLHKQTGEVKVTSLVRDLYVTMGDAGLQDKIETAYAYGGENLLMQTINRLFNLNIERYVTVDFAAICDIVDVLGGVSVQLAEGEAAAINESVQTTYTAYANGQVVPLPEDAAQAKLCGAQALAYARTRNMAGGASRQDRQKKLLSAMLDQMKESSLLSLMGVAKTCFDYMKTNILLTEMITLGTGILDHGVAGVSMRSFPEYGEYSSIDVGGESRMVVDPLSAAQTLHAFIYQ